MAAYAALVSLAKVVEQILDHDQHCIFLHERKQNKSLHKNIIFSLTFLEDFPGEAVNFEARITIAANQAEDIIDEFHILNKNGSESGMPYNWQRLCKELEKAIKDIQSVVEEAMLTTSNVSKNQDLMSTHSSGSSSSRLAPNGEDTVVGFEEDLMKIKGRLCGEPSRLQIIPIVGMGGIGKTTLARYAHDDPLTVQQFDVRAWVTVSQNYHIHGILLSLLNHIYEGKTHDFGHRVIGTTCVPILKREEVSNVWDDLQRVFPDDLNGSRIIMTTRDLDVASYIDTSSQPHKMQLMGVDQSWNLLRQKVFAEEHCPPELEQIGKQIAET